MALSEIITKYSKKIESSKSCIVSVQLFKTPIGNVFSAADDNYLYLAIFEDSKNFEKSLLALCRKLSCVFVENKNKILAQLELEYLEYFDGYLKKFTVPIKTFGSQFQQEVWNKLQALPYASTQTYGDLAKALGREASHSRAIGAACGANAHIIIIPCHRLVASGSKGGFSCGVDRKEWLIEHEAKHTES